MRNYELPQAAAEALIQKLCLNSSKNVNKFNLRGENRKKVTSKIRWSAQRNTLEFQTTPESEVLITKRTKWGRC
jgi:hypothetical protein